MPNLIAHLGLNDREFNSKLGKARTSVTGFAKSMRTLGVGLSAAGITSFFNQVIQRGSALSDQATQLRINVEALQALNYAAQKAGVDQETFGRALRNVSLRTQEAVDGNTRYQEAIARLNLDLDTFKNLPTERKLEAIAQAYASANDQQEAYRDVATILGERAGPKLLEVLSRLASEGFDGVAASARAAGQVIDEETIGKLDAAADEIEKLKTRVIVFGAEILRFVQKYADALGTFYGALSRLDFDALREGFADIFTDADAARAADAAEDRLAAARKRGFTAANLAKGIGGTPEQQAVARQILGLEGSLSREIERDPSNDLATRRFRAGRLDRINALRESIGLDPSKISLRDEMTDALSETNAKLDGVRTAIEDL